MPVEDRHAAHRADRGATRDGDCVWLEITANAYLHHMVRNIVGTLIDVQREADPAAAMARILAAAIGGWPARPRRPAGCTCGGWSIRRSSGFLHRLRPFC